MQTVAIRSPEHLNALTTAFSPSHGVAPCAERPCTASRIASTPFACTPTWRLVGSPVIAKSPMNPPSTSASDRRGCPPPRTPRPRRSQGGGGRPPGRGDRRGPAASRPAHPSCRRRRGRTAGRRRCGARTARGRLEPRRYGRAGPASAPSAGPTSAIVTGSPRDSVWAASMSFDSSQPLDEPGGSAAAPPRSRCRRRSVAGRGRVRPCSHRRFRR